ncbi:hypothetical protein AAIA72_15590 [Hahella sp. SMD15-11]|uniref:Uncharacterized protein n=1 Tax=Thermohahella caldifontis TaxID=3142973 RepID=A0AB39UW23_9GAMM
MSRAVEGRVTAAEAMQGLARSMDESLARMAREPSLKCAPVLNDPEPEEVWLKRPGAPWPAMDEPEKGVTLPYEDAIKVWR